MKFYITGISGTGKSTIVNELNKRGIKSFDVDSVSGLCSWENKETGKGALYKPGIGKEWIQAHDWICDLKELKKLLNTYKEDIVVAGITANQDDYLNLFDKVFLLYCNKKSLIHRLNTRSNSEFAKESSEQEQVLKWHREFQKKMIEKGAVPINTEDSIAVVVDKIISEIKSK